MRISRRVATNFSSLQGEIRGERSAEEEEEEAEVERQKRGTEAARSRRAAAVD